MLRFLLVLPLVTSISAAEPQPDPVRKAALHDTSKDRLSFIENEQIKVGINADLGGAITWISAPGRDNIININDWGREIQLSFYSGPHGFAPAGKTIHPNWPNWSWNPIQSGDVYRNRAKIVSLTNTGSEISLTTIPLQWALDNVPGDCVCEAKLTLDGPMLRVHYKLINQRSDQTYYAPFDQELPAVYTVSGLNHLMTYNGDQPFTGGPLTRITNDFKAKFPWARFITTEGWVAAVGDDNWGLGICNPTVYSYLGGIHGTAISWDPKAGPTMYISPVSADVLDHNIVFEFELMARVGSLQSIRDYFAPLMAKRAPPVWDFARDRQHWTVRDAIDGGWPIIDGVKITTEKNKVPRFEGPTQPFRADAAPIMRITGTWQGLSGTGQVRWQTLTGKEFVKPGISFPLPTTNTPTTVEINLGQSADYRGLITKFQIIAADQPTAGGSVSIAKIEMVAGAR